MEVPRHAVLLAHVCLEHTNCFKSTDEIAFCLSLLYMISQALDAVPAYLFSLEGRDIVYKYSLGGRDIAHEAVYSITTHSMAYCHIHKGSPIIPILSRINPIPSIDTYFLRSIQILSSHLRIGLPRGLSPVG